MSGPEQYQLDHQFRMQILSLLNKLLLYATFVILGYYCFQCITACIRELAGRQTNASIFLRVYAALRIPRTLAMVLAYVFAFGNAGWALGERRSKKKIIARTHPLIRDAQRVLDPNKGSSNITLHGNTGPEDL